MSLSRIAWLPVGALMVLSLGCTKYEQDGSLLHFRSPEKRLVGTWTAESVTEIEFTADSTRLLVFDSPNLRLNATFEEGGNLTFENVGEELVFEGSWVFSENHAELLLELATMRILPPTFLDQNGIDRESDLSELLLTLQSTSPLFLQEGSHVDVTADVLACADLLQSTGLFWYLVSGLGENGELTVDGDTFYPGDNISLWTQGVIEESMTDWIEDETATGPDDLEGIVTSIYNNYGVEVVYNEQTEPLISGLDDPNLLALVAQECGTMAFQVVEYPSGVTDAFVLAYAAENLGWLVNPVAEEQDLTLSLVWEMLELELDDMQAYQRASSSAGDSATYDFLFRWEKQD